MPPPIVTAAPLPLPVCGVDDGSDAVVVAVLAAAAACERARTHLAAADPRVWEGSTASAFRARKVDDTARLNGLADDIHASQSAAVAHVTSRRELVAALTTGSPGAGWG